MEAFETPDPDVPTELGRWDEDDDDLEERRAALDCFRRSRCEWETASARPVYEAIHGDCEGSDNGAEIAYKMFATTLGQQTVQFAARVAALRLNGVAWFNARDVIAVNGIRSSNQCRAVLCR